MVFGVPMKRGISRRVPRPLNVMKSRVVGFALPDAFTTRSRSACRPPIDSSSSAVNGSSRPFVAKSKFRTSESRTSESSGCASPSMYAAFSAASSAVSPGMQ